MKSLYTRIISISENLALKHLVGNYDIDTTGVHDFDELKSRVNAWINARITNSSPVELIKFIEEWFYWDPSDLNLKRLGYLYFQNQNYIKSFSNYLKVEEKNSKVWIGMAANLRVMKDPLQALKCLQKAFDDSSDQMQKSIALYNMGIIYEEQEERQDAFSAYKRALFFNPQNKMANERYEILRKYFNDADEQ